jgi:hypothetical protein
VQHYYIQWAHGKVDWQAFGSEEEAEKEAERLKRPSERYSIVRRDGECRRCMEIKSKVKKLN